MTSYRPQIGARRPQIGGRRICATRREIEALLLLSLRSDPESADVLHVTIYPREERRWTVGHIRLGPSRRFSLLALDRAARQLQREYDLLD